MKFKIKRILSVLLVFCMMMGVMPNMLMTAHAAGDTLTWDEDSSGELIVKWDPSYFDNDGSLWVRVTKNGFDVDAFYKATILGSVSVGQIIRDNGSGKYVVSVSKDGGAKELTTSEKTINFSEQLAEPVVSYDAATMTLSWEPVTNAAHYHLKVYMDGTGTASMKVDRTLTDTTVDLSDRMGAAGKYYIYLQAISTDKNCASSKKYHMEITKESTIPAVTGLKINDYILSWDACTDANRYWFYVEKNGMQIGAPSDWVEDTSKDLLEIFAKYGAGEYTFGVSAYYGGLKVREEASINFTNSDPYAVRVIAAPAEGGTVTGSGTYKEGVKVTVTATPNAGYKFLCWTMDGGYVNSNPTYTFDASSRILRAEFEKTTPSTYTITATAGTGGTISPSGEVTVNKGAGVSFEIKPNDGYEIKNVIVDGTSVGAVATYSFSDVKANHTIEAVFEDASTNICKITATAGEGGTISPSGESTLWAGAIQTYTIKPNDGYKIKDVIVDGTSVGAVATYSFSDIKANHTIEAVFEEVTPPIEITELNATVVAPVAGESPSTVVTTTGEGYTVSVAYWYDKDDNTDFSKFEAGGTYEVQVTFTPKEGYVLADEDVVTATINGKTAEVYMSRPDTGALDFGIKFDPASDPIVISELNATVVAPVAGEVPSTVVTTTGEGYTVSVAYWYDKDDNTDFSKFEAGGTYEVQVTFTPKEGYVLADEDVLTVTINGKAAELYMYREAALDFGVKFDKLEAETPPTEYDITVNGGTASVGAGTAVTKATAGTEITLTVDESKIPAGKVFDKWEVVSGGVTVADGKFTMPANAVEIEATYKDAPVIPTEYDITVTGGTASANKAVAGTVITLTVDESAIPAGKVFDKWEVVSGGVTVADGKFTMPANAVEIRATYKDAPVIPTEYDITVTGGTASANKAVAGTVITLTVDESAIPAGKVFDKWEVVSGGVTVTDGKFTMPTNAVEIRATYKDAPVSHTCDIKPVAKDEPSCTEGGKEAYYKCEGCGKFYEDALGAKEITDLANWGNLPKLGHTESDWKSDKDNHWKECTVTACGVIIEDSKAAHKDDNKDGKCDVCEYNVGLPTTPDDDKPNDNPQTGDNSNMFLWIALLFISGAGVVATTVFGKKRFSVK